MATAKKKTIETLEVDEIIETIPTREVHLDSLEKNFNIFILNITTHTESISKNINMDELNEIGDEIIKAKEYLTSFASGEKKTIREKAYNQLSLIPYAGDWAKKKAEAIKLQSLKDSSVKEVLDDMFNNFDIKKKRLIELTYLAEEIKTSLLSQEGQLTNYIADLDYVIETTTSAGDKMRALDMSIQAQTSEKVIKDQVYNKLEFIIELMTNLMHKMSKTLPTLKTQLINETSFAGMINSITDSVKMLDSLQTLTNDITRISTENIQEEIINVTKTMTNGADIEFYKKSAEINNKYQETLKQCRIKQIKSTIDNYDALKTISVSSDNLLENRINSERIALGITIEAKKDKVEQSINEA